MAAWLYMLGCTSLAAVLIVAVIITKRMAAGRPVTRIKKRRHGK